MGCDGGTIPRRDELVRVKKKPEQKDKDAEREFRWLHCALTQQRLQQPIVICSLGRLYSKQSVIEYLLEKEMPESASHIKSMKDIKQLNLTPNPAYEDIEKKQMGEEARAPYICKLIGLEMSGKFRFVALWSCGCVMSERALKQIKGNICAICQTPFGVEDVVVLNANDDELEIMLAKRDIRVAKLKSKKSKAKKDVKVDEEPSTSKAVTENGNNKIKQICVKRGGANNDALKDPEIKRLKTDYSVAKDPKASDVYKSLFTTHKSEQEQSRAHWVTYNPFYN